MQQRTISNHDNTDFTDQKRAFIRFILHPSAFILGFQPRALPRRAPRHPLKFSRVAGDALSGRNGRRLEPQMNADERRSKSQSRLNMREQRQQRRVLTTDSTDFTDQNVFIRETISQILCILRRNLSHP
jgi:hypothetical protein